MIPSILTILALAQTPAASSPMEIRPGLFVLSGTPDKSTIESLQNSGITQVIDLRKPTEGDFTWEASAIRAKGGMYYSCPTDKEPSPSQIDAFRSQMMALPKGCKVFVHCAVGNRAGGVLLAYWVLDAGVAEQDALGLAHKAGLRNPVTETAVQAYLANHRNPPGTIQSRTNLKR